MYDKQTRKSALENTHQDEFQAGQDSFQDRVMKRLVQRRAMARVIPPQPPMLLKSCSASADKIIELTSADQIPAEMGKTGARYIHVVAGGTSYYLDFGPTADGLPQALSALTSGLLDDNGKVREGVDPSTFYHLDGSDIVAGEARYSVSYGGTRTTGEVLGDSNDLVNTPIAGDDPDAKLKEKRNQLWLLVNGGSEDPATPEGQKKDPSWYNAIVLEKDAVSVDKSDKDQRKGLDLPEFSLEEYRRMLVLDFNFYGAIDEFNGYAVAQGRSGQEVFVEAVLASHPKDDPQRLRVIATEVWSYATTGADSKGVTDVAQLQGLLYALDPNIQVSSDSNTKMEKNKQFNAGTKEAPVWLHQGDGRHGRATILSTRHLLANVKLEEVKRVATRQPSVLFGGNDRFVRDDSDSMKRVWTMIRDATDQTLQQGQFGPNGTTPGVDQKVDGKFDENSMAVPQSNRSSTGNSSQSLSDFAVVVEGAYRQLYQHRTQADATAFLTLFDLGTRPPSQFFTINSSTNEYELDGGKLLKELGDGYQTTGVHDAEGESSLKALVIALVWSSQYSPDKNQLGPPVDPTVRLNAIADEGEQGLEYLELVKALSMAMGIQVRIVAVPTNAATINLATDVALIDIQTMTIVQVGGQDVLQYMAVINGVATPMSVPLQYDPTNRGTARFSAGWVPLITGQNAPDTH